MAKKLGQEPAFPLIEKQIDNGIAYDAVSPGMSKRFYAACAAMQGLLTNMSMVQIITKKADEGNIDWKENLAIHSFVIADELLKQENE